MVNVPPKELELDSDSEVTLLDLSPLRENRWVSTHSAASVHGKANPFRSLRI
jgi:hypothetical protein